jgi:hypothetical protein
MKNSALQEHGLTAHGHQVQAHLLEREFQKALPRGTYCVGLLTSYQIC